MIGCHTNTATAPLSACHEVPVKRWSRADLNLRMTKEERSSSNRPELAAFLLALRDTLVEEPLLYLCDNQSLLVIVKDSH